LGVKQDYRKAVECYQKGYEWDIPHDAYSLGLCYYYGLGVDKNFATALEYLLEASVFTIPDCWFLLGEIYSDRSFIHTSPKKAVLWYGRAAHERHPGACYKYGCCLMQGFGVQKNETDAFKWFQLSAETAYNMEREKLSSGSVE
jgi:hypothetical protein